MLHLFDSPLRDLVKTQRDILAQTRAGYARCCLGGYKNLLNFDERVAT